MRSSVVVLLAVAVSLDALKLMKLVPKSKVLSSKIHDKIASVTNTIGDVQSSVNGAGERLITGLDKVKDLLLSVDEYFHPHSEQNIAEATLDSSEPLTTPEHDARRFVANQFAEENAQVAQVPFNTAQSQLQGPPFQTAQGRILNPLTTMTGYQYGPGTSVYPLQFSQRDMKAAQIPFSSRFVAGRTYNYPHNG